MAWLAAVLATGPGAARATDWRIVIADPTIAVMVDADTFRRDGDMRSFGMAFHLAKAVDHRTTGFIGTTRMDCAHKLSQTTELRDMRRDGTTVPSRNLDTGFVPVEPKSLDDVFFRRMCEIDLPSDGVGGVALQVPPEIAARAVFGLMKLGLLSEPSSRLAAYPYENTAALEQALRNARVAAPKRPMARRILAAQVEPAPPPPAPIVPLPAAVASGRVGHYTYAEHELVAALWLRADGRFRYGLTVGSLDEVAGGRWTTDGTHIHLVSEPRPIPPTITAGPARRDPGVALSLLVATPKGDGVPGVDLVIGFDAGESTDGYTQADGWALPKEEKRVPRWVELSMESYGLKSPRFPINQNEANVLAFVLTPNDIGVIDLSDTVVDISGRELIVHRHGGTMRFSKVGK
ncbi:MAG: hypothetical protein ACRYHQ_34085 [Janthinobacterium lividum]